MEVDLQFGEIAAQPGEKRQERPRQEMAVDSDGKLAEVAQTNACGGLFQPVERLARAVGQRPADWR